MKLAKQTLLYSAILMTVIIGLLTAYMMLMMPSLYVAHRTDQNLAEAKAIHRRFNETGTLAGGDTPASAFTVVLPKSGYRLRLYHRYFEGAWDIPPGPLQEAVDDLRNTASDPKQLAAALEQQNTAEADAYWTALTRAAQDQLGLRELPAGLQIRTYDQTVNSRNTAQRFYRMGDDGFALANTLRENRLSYSSYFLLTDRTDSWTITLMNVITPDIRDVQPVIAGSLPMIVLVLGLVVLLTSQIFSRRIVQPIARLAHHVAEARECPIADVPPIELTGRDEIADLGRELNALYARLQASDRAQTAAAQRRSVFLRASSHQLKTPIAAALLLADGMINQIGRYRDRDRYLPAVKAQLKSMQTMVEDVLHLSRSEQQMESAPFDLGAMARRLSEQYADLAADRSLRIQTAGQGRWVTDGEILTKMVDNLVSNAVAYTDPGGTVQITVSNTAVQVFNRPARIPDHLLPDIFEPFVTGNTAQKGHGLGLYVVRYYAGLLGLSVRLTHADDGVMVRLESAEAAEPAEPTAQTDRP